MVAEEVEAPLDAADEGLVRVLFEERRESAYGYKQLCRSALRDGELGAQSGPLRRFRLLYARLRTSIGRGL